MHRPCPVSRSHLRRLATLVFTLPLAMALFVWPHAAGAASISSRILIDPAGENDGDAFGCSVASVGDVNGDGYDDLIIGANFYPAQAGHGRAYLYFGGPAIDSVADLVIPAPAGPSIAWFGISVASGGDFNGDGYPDFIIGARYSGLQGKAFIYYGGPSLDATPDLTLIGETTGSSTYFGTSVASAGDLNGDGFDDVIVGAPLYGSGGNQTGRAYVFFGGAVPDSVPDRVFTAVGANDQLGYVVGSAGDINGDGHPDVFASAPSNDAAALNAGAIYVWFGGPSFDANADLTILGTGVNERLLNAANAGDVNDDGFSDLIASEKDHARVYFGGPSPDAIADLTLARNYATVAGAGDINGDGIDDFVLGDPGDNTGGAGAGRVSVFFGGSPVDTLEDISFTGDRSGRFLGQCVAGGGHVDGPGPADLIVSATEDPEQVGYNRGRVYVIATSFGTVAVPVTPATGLVLEGATPNPAVSGLAVAFALPRARPATLQILDAAGRVLATRPVGSLGAGRHIVDFSRSRHWTPGIYFAVLRQENHTLVRKTCVVR